MGDDIGQLRRLAGIGEGDDRIALGDHAEIAMAGLGGVNEEGRGSCRGQGGGDLAGDEAALAHAGDDHPPLDRGKQLQRPVEAGVQAGGQGLQPLGRQTQDALGNQSVGSAANGPKRSHDPAPPRCPIPKAHLTETQRERDTS